MLETLLPNPDAEVHIEIRERSGFLDHSEVKPIALYELERAVIDAAIALRRAQMLGENAICDVAIDEEAIHGRFKESVDALIAAREKQ
ncbi:MAG TPA: hypothetical protein VFX97_16910 [Pyrinomonadaceae bacterium]|nr:hypothetical protein [Pyrinomonadaceae bacterium]